MTRAALIAAALPLAACAGGAYEYDYDPWRGPHGHYVGGFLDAADHRPPRPCPREEFRGPHYDGFRAPWLSGPYCADLGNAAPAAATVPDAPAP